MTAIKRFEYVQFKRDNFQELKDFITQDHIVSDRSIGALMDENSGHYLVRESVSRQYSVVYADDFYKQFELTWQEVMVMILYKYGGHHGIL